MSILTVNSVSGILMSMSNQNGQGSQNSPSSPASDQVAPSSTPSTRGPDGVCWDYDFSVPAHGDSCPCSHCYGMRHEQDDARRRRELLEMGLSERELVEPPPERSDRVRHPRRARDPHLELVAMVEAEAVQPPTAAPAPARTSWSACASGRRTSASSAGRSRGAAPSGRAGRCAARSRSRRPWGDQIV